MILRRDAGVSQLADHGLLNVRMLDRVLASGAPTDSPDRLLRARELCSAAERQELGRSLVVILPVAQHAVSDPLTRLDAPAILRCAGRLRALVALLDSGCPFRVQGLALAWLLLEEPTSPLFRTDSKLTLEAALDEITAAL